MPKTEIDRVKIKTLDSQFEQLLLENYELPPKMAKSIVEDVNDVYQLEHHDPSKSAAKNKIVRTVIAKKAKHGPKLEKLPKVQVVLTREITKEDKNLYREEGKQGLRQAKILRLTNEALDQKGLLTQEDLADILEVSSRTVRRDINSLKARDFDVPTRGDYLDIGPGRSHKSKIIELYLEYNTYSEIKRKTRHSSQAIKRYLKEFGRVLLSLKNNLPLKETSHIVGISDKLAKEYSELYLKYNTAENQERIADIVNRARREASAKAEAKKGVQS